MPFAARSQERRVLRLGEAVRVRADGAWQEQRELGVGIRELGELAAERRREVRAKLGAFVSRSYGMTEEAIRPVVAGIRNTLPLAKLEELQANVAVRSGRQAVEEGVPMLIDRGVLVADRNRLRVRNRIVLRYYARTLEHLLGEGFGRLLFIAPNGRHRVRLAAAQEQARQAARGLWGACH